MKDYFSGWPRYAERLFKRIDFLLGGLLAVLVFFLADHIQIGDYQLSHHRGIVTLVIAILALAESGYRVYREEHDMRTKFAAHVRVSAKLKRLAFDHPDPGPGQTLLTAEVGWEIWTDAEVFTDQLALNMIYVYDKRWWQFWR